MEKLIILFLLIIIFLSLATFSRCEEVDGVSKGSREHQNGQVRKLFVFGDSYADTGNTNPFTSSWQPPYGMTFPGKPTGRFCDGRVLTDYIAKFLGIRSPIPYKFRKVGKKSKIENGMNFAHGGTGVFNTMVNEPNMTTQINYFKQLIEEKVFTKHDLNQSIALVSVAGNDYATFLLRNGNLLDIPAYTSSIINQVEENVRQIQKLGVSKIVLTAIEPMGCIPQLASSSSYQSCNQVWNFVSYFHNRMLQQLVIKLNTENNNSPILILDLYHAFLSAFQQLKSLSGKKEVNPLKPCCIGVSNGYSCGSLDKNGAKKYNVCENIEESFFWDTIHPTQNGWRLVYSMLKPHLHSIYQ